MANYFRPPTIQMPHAGPEDRFWSRVKYPRGRTVLNVEPAGQPGAGAITVFPGRLDVDADVVKACEAAGGRAYLGGGVYLLSAQEVTDLTAAGYGSFISGQGP